MVGSPPVRPGGRFSISQLVPLLPLSVLVALALSTGVAYDRSAAFLEYCHGSLYARSCIAELQLLQIEATAWIVTSAVIVVLLVLVHAAPAQAWRFGASPLALIGYSVFLAVWGLLGVLASQGGGYGRLPRGIGLTFLMTYLAASLLQFAAAFVPPVARGARAKFAMVGASAHGLVATILGFVYAYALLLPTVAST